MYQILIYYVLIVTEKTTKRMKRSRNGRLFSEHRHRSFFGPHKMGSSSLNSSSPSPRHINNAVIQTELNDYLGRVLNCLSKLYILRNIYHLNQYVYE